MTRRTFPALHYSSHLVTPTSDALRYLPCIYGFISFAPSIAEPGVLASFFIVYLLASFVLERRRNICVAQVSGEVMATDTLIARASVS